MIHFMRKQRIKIVEIRKVTTLSWKRGVEQVREKMIDSGQANEIQHMYNYHPPPRNKKGNHCQNKYLKMLFKKTSLKQNLNFHNDRTNSEGTQLSHNYRSKREAWLRELTKILCVCVCVFVCVAVLVGGYKEMVVSPGRNEPEAAERVDWKKPFEVCSCSCLSSGLFWGSRSCPILDSHLLMTLTVTIVDTGIITRQYKSPAGVRRWRKVVGWLSSLGSLSFTSSSSWHPGMVG